MSPRVPSSETFSDSSALDETWATPTSLAVEVADGSVTVPDAAALFRGEFRDLAGDLVIVHGHKAFQIPDYFQSDTPVDLLSPDGAILKGETVKALAGARAPGQYAQAGTGLAAAPIGSVETIEGSANVLRPNGTRAQLVAGDPVFQGDVVETGGGSSLSIVFVDDTLFSLSADARMVLDELVYSPGGSDNSMVMNLVQGTFVFVTGQVAPTGNMQIETPVATMGIRGTTPVVQIDAINGSTRFSLSPDPDGTVGSYQLFDKLSGQLLGTVSTTDQLLAIASIGAAPVEQPKTQADLDAERAQTEKAFNAYQQARGGQQGQGPDGGGDGNPPPGPQGPNNLPGQGPNDPGPANGLDGGNGTPPLGGGQNGPAPLGGQPPGGPGGLNLLNGPGGGGPQQPGGPLPPRPPQNGDQQGNLENNLQIRIPTQTVNVVEDTSIVLDGLSVDDPNNGQLSLTLTAFSTVTLASTAGLTFQVGDGVDDEHMVFFGSEDAVNAALRGMTYTPTPDSETGGLQIAVFDGTDWITSTVPIEITPEPDAPKVFDIALTVEEGASITAPFVGLDPDVGDTITLNTLGNPSKGTLTQSADGTFTFNTGKDFDALGNDESEVVTFQYTAKDSTGLVSEMPATVTITVTGKNSDAEITGDLAGTATEDQTAVVTGTLTVKDTDEGEDKLLAQTTKGTYGDLVAAEDGQWTFTLDNTRDAVQGLGKGELKTDTFKVSSKDESATVDVKIDVTGVNDDITIGTADLSGSVEEDATEGTLTDSGTIAFKDPDLSDQHTATVTLSSTTAQSQLGTLSASVSSSSGSGDVTWVYSVSNDAVDFLKTGESVVETFNIELSDNNGSTETRQVAVTIQGKTDGLTIEGDLFGTVVEDNTLTASGELTAKDDSGVEGKLLAETINGVRGSLVVQEDGLWAYTLNNTLKFVQGLGQNEIKTETFEVFGEDEESSVFINIDVTGTNDIIVVGTSDLTGEVIEDQAEGTLTDTGAIEFTDADLNDGYSATATFQNSDAESQLGNLAATVSATSGIGTVTWTYSVLNSALDYLDTGESVTETFSIELTDNKGSTVTRTVSVTADGNSDENEIEGDLTGSIFEDDMSSISGSLSVKNDEGATFQSRSEVIGTYGVFDLNTDGTWSYDLDNSLEEVQALTEGEEVTDTFSVLADDGETTDDVVITVTGKNDAPQTDEDEPSLFAIAVGGAIGEELTLVTAENPAKIKVADLVANDSDPEDDTFSLTGVAATSTKGASLTLNGDGTITYDPTAAAALTALLPGQELVDTFTYTVTDENSASATGHVFVRVGGGAVITAGPDVVWSNFSTNETLEVPISALLANDTDAGGSDLTFSLVSGTASISGGLLEFDYPVGWDGSETLTYKVTNGDGDFETTTLQINEFLDPDENALEGTEAAEILVGRNSEDSGGSPVDPDDVIKGFGENDQLYGLEGSDLLEGGGGDDLLAGGLGIDDLYGGDGADTFQFSETDSIDVVWDYEVGTDRLDLEHLLDVLFTEGNKADYISIDEVIIDGVELAQVSVDQDGAGVEFGQAAIVMLDGITAGAVIDIVFNSNGDETQVTVAAGGGGGGGGIVLT